jgi:hypothetical protein
MTHSEPEWWPQRNETDEERQARQLQAQRDNERRQRETEEARRALFTAFRLWQACPDKHCKRAAACRGDLDECRRQRWRVCVPDEVRAVLSKACEFAKDGMPWREAVDAAEQDVNNRLAIAARYKAALEAAAPPGVTVAHPQERPGPRIRSL